MGGAEDRPPRPALVGSARRRGLGARPSPNTVPPGTRGRGGPGGARGCEGPGHFRGPGPAGGLGRTAASATGPCVPAGPAAGSERPAGAGRGSPVPPLPPLLVALPPRLDAAAAPTTRRWSLSAWSFVRPGGAAALATGGLLGGSQAGARLVWRLNPGAARPLALSARLSAPLARAAGTEAAIGLDWVPVARLPVHLLAERRQALGGEGRSAFALTALGGMSDARLGRFRLDAYAQAGLVGARSRDLFADGSIRLSLPLDRNLRVGAGAWAAAQPGLARLDLGPQASLRLPGRAVTLAADWRLRAAGNAEPGSGPTITLSTDF